MISEFDIKILRAAIELSKNCPVSYTAYSVGAIIVDRNNTIVSTGYSRETADNMHAEEVAITKASNKGISLHGATIYSTMEPCGLRLSGKECCSNIIIKAGIHRVVYGVKEPQHLVQNTTGIQKIKDAGLNCEQIEALLQEVLQINNHIK